MSNRLYVKVLLDNSGSMLANKSVTLTALNKYLDGLQDDAVVSVNLFGYVTDVKRTKVDKQAAKIKPQEYPCDKGTALFDAIGVGISQVDEEAKDFDRIVLVVQTDGQERDSREFTLPMVQQLLRDKQEGEGWLVVFLGAGLQAFAQAGAMGFLQANSLQYDAAASTNAFQGATRSTMAYAASQNRAEGIAASAFTPEERARSRRG
jgi:hypothetical protein